MLGDVSFRQRLVKTVGVPAHSVEAEDVYERGDAVLPCNLFAFDITARKI